jgi:hypothetical protein
MWKITSSGPGHVSVAMPHMAISAPNPKFEYRNPKQIRSPKFSMTETTCPMVLIDRKDSPHGLGHSGFGHSILPFDLTQGGESFDLAQDLEPVERPVESF